MSKGDKFTNVSGAEGTFGRAFGDLIRLKRGQEGLTQRQVAELAFGDESKVRRIIDLENGAVRRPHAGTVDPLVVYFNITQEEMSKCREVGLFSAEERAVIGLPRDLLENLSLRFEVEDPDASDDELLTFLKGKARELKEVKARLKKIDEFSEVVGNQIRLAEIAIEEGDFAGADKILAVAEDAHEESQTIKSIELQSHIRIARADAALMIGKTAEAAGHYARAANYFFGFSKERTAGLMADSAGRIYEVERRRPKPSFVSAIPLAENALELTSADQISSRFLRQYQLSLLHLSEARNTAVGANAHLEEADRLLSDVLTYSGMGISIDDRLNAKIVLANVYFQRAERPGSRKESLLDTCISMYSDCISLAMDHGRPMQLCHLHNNIAAAYRELAGLAKSSDAANISRRAREHLRSAIDLSGEHELPEVWSSAQYNLGGAFAEDAVRSKGRDVSFLRIQAISAFHSSIEAYPKTAVNWHLAKTNLALGRVLFDHALSVGSDIQEIYLSRAIASSEVAAWMYDRSGGDDGLAIARFQIGIALFVHSETADPQVALSDIEMAISNFEECIALVDVDINPELHEKCLRALETSRQAIIDLGDR